MAKVESCSFGAAFKHLQGRLPRMAEYALAYEVGYRKNADLIRKRVTLTTPSQYLLKLAREDKYMIKAWGPTKPSPKVVESQADLFENSYFRGTEYDSQR